MEPFAWPSEMLQGAETPALSEGLQFSCVLSLLSLSHFSGFLAHFISLAVVPAPAPIMWVLTAAQ